jgi:hypothetical protein
MGSVGCASLFRLLPFQLAQPSSYTTLPNMVSKRASVTMKECSYWHGFTRRIERDPEAVVALRLHAQLPEQERINIRLLFNLLADGFPGAMPGFAFDA